MGLAGTQTPNERIMSLFARNSISQPDNGLHESPKDGCRYDFELTVDSRCESARSDLANLPEVASIDDPELLAIMESWPNLSRSLRKAVLSICRSSLSETD